MQAKVSFNIRIDKDVNEILEVIKRKTGYSKSEIINAILKAHISGFENGAKEDELIKKINRFVREASREQPLGDIVRKLELPVLIDKLYDELRGEVDVRKAKVYKDKLKMWKLTRLKVDLDEERMKKLEFIIQRVYELDKLYKKVLENRSLWFNVKRGEKKVVLPAVSEVSEEPEIKVVPVEEVEIKEEIEEEKKIEEEKRKLLEEIDKFYEEYKSLGVFSLGRKKELRKKLEELIERAKELGVDVSYVEL